MKRTLLAALATAAVALLLVPVASSASPASRHGGGDSGMTDVRLASQWWQWALKIPVHTPAFGTTVNHPLVDLTGARCGVGQTGSVWFLGGAFFELGHLPAGEIRVSRSCTVPRGTTLYFPILNSSCTAVEVVANNRNGCGFDRASSRAAVAGNIDAATVLVATVDGKPVRAVRVGLNKEGYCVNLPADDLLSFIGEGPAAGGGFSPGASCPTFDDGVYVTQAPFTSDRTHTVHTRGEIPSFGFVLDVTYKIKVDD